MHAPQTGDVVRYQTVNRSTFSGAVTVRIGTDGRVESAEITRTVHPTYDQLLLRAARNCARASHSSTRNSTASSSPSQAASAWTATGPAFPWVNTIAAGRS